MPNYFRNYATAPAQYPRHSILDAKFLITMSNPSRSSSSPMRGFDFALDTAANPDSPVVDPSANASRTRQRYLATHAPPLSSSITAAVRNQARQRAQQQAARARSAVLERARQSRSSRTNAPTPGDYQAVEEMQSIVQAHWEEFTSGFTQDEAHQLDVDQLAELEAEFLQECETAARQGLHETSHQVAPHALMTPQREHAAAGPRSSPWPGPPWPSSPMQAPSSSPPVQTVSCFMCGAPDGMGNASSVGQLACLNCGVVIATTLTHHVICDRIAQARGYHAGVTGCQANLATGYHPEEGLMVYCPQCEFVDVILS